MHAVLRDLDDGTVWSTLWGSAYLGDFEGKYATCRVISLHGVLIVAVLKRMVST